MTVEDDSIEGKTELGGGFDEGIEEEGVRVKSRVEEESASVGDCTGGASKCDELREESSAPETAGDNEMGMGLLEESETRTCPEKSSIFWRL